MSSNIKIAPHHESTTSFIIEINSGIKTLRKPTIENGQYLSGTFIPKDDFIPMTSSEKALLIASQDCDFENAIHLGSIPIDLSSLFFQLYFKYINKSNILDEQEIIINKIVEEFHNSIIDKVKTSLKLKLDIASYVIQATNKKIIQHKAIKNYNITDYSTTQSPRSPFKLRGLHIDNWQRPRIRVNNRGKAGLKIGINLGIEDRNIVFISIPLNEMIKRIKDKAKLNKYINSDFATPIGELFMLENPYTQVIKITIPQNHYYIMPVQNIIHDGFPKKQIFTDYNYMISLNSFSI